MKTPEHILQIIRQRLDLNEDDASRDDFIERMTPIQKLRAVCGWELGSEAWADEFVGWARDCGMTVDAGEDE